MKLRTLITTITLCTSSCMTQGEEILEYKDVQFFHAESKDNHPIKLEISGLAFHSSLAIDSITTKTESDKIAILAKLTLARPGISGRFNYTLTIPDNVNEVQFGTERVVIWKR